MVVPNNCVNTHRVVACVRVLYYFLSRFLSSIINNVPPIFVGGILCLVCFKFFHKYLLEVRLFHKLNWLFWLGASSIQKGYLALSVLAFLLVLCVFRGGRRFFIGSKSFSLRFKSSKFKVQIFKESTELRPQNFKPKTLEL
ncbi:hypothetical protein FO675_07800 [Riemerella anatipestifer]|uniref:Uncharacterized protein n=1 Tax=Riemerella anatipestifer TaxID=34085 RepID=A0A1S7DQ32_RIEAN|nr:hypothetical protein AB406_0253 [Riemerella anatipestifer]MBO4234195.1 hypothetical protein [Riemerella anatipestifer]